MDEYICIKEVNGEKQIYKFVLYEDNKYDMFIWRQSWHEEKEWFRKCVIDEYKFKQYISDGKVYKLIT